MSNLSSIQISSRDRFVMLVLPALAIFIFYSYVLTKKPNARLKLLTTQLAAAQAARPSNEAIAQQQAAKLSGSTRLTQTRHELEPIREALSQQMDSWQDRGRRLQANDDLAVLWRRHSLTLIEQSYASTNEVGMTPLVERLQQQTRTLLNREFGPVLWEVRLEGGFHGIRNALEEISTSDLPVIPVSLEMQNKPQTTIKLWTVRLWQ